MLIENPNDSIAKAKLRGPLYIWIGFVLVSAYFTWEAFDITGTRFQLDFPKFDASNPTMLPLTISAIFNLILAWLLPEFLLRRNRSLSSQFIAFVIRMGLIGSVVMYGLVCANTGHDGHIVLPFSIFAFLGFIRSFPREKTFRFD